MRRHRIGHAARMVRPVLRAIPERIDQVKHIKDPHPNFPQSLPRMVIQGRIPCDASDARGVVGVVLMETSDRPRVRAKPGHAPPYFVVIGC